MRCSLKTPSSSCLLDKPIAIAVLFILGWSPLGCAYTQSADSCHRYGGLDEDGRGRMITIGDRTGAEPELFQACAMKLNQPGEDRCWDEYMKQCVYPLGEESAGGGYPNRGMMPISPEHMRHARARVDHWTARRQEPQRESERLARERMTAEADLRRGAAQKAASDKAAEERKIQAAIDRLSQDGMSNRVYDVPDVSNFVNDPTQFVVWAGKFAKTGYPGYTPPASSNPYTVAFAVIAAIREEVARLTVSIMKRRYELPEAEELLTTLRQRHEALSDMSSALPKGGAAGNQ